MRFRKRGVPRASDHRQISIVIVSSDAPDAKEYRFSRAGFQMLLGVLGFCVLLLLGFSLTSPYLAGSWLSSATANPWKTQLDEANRKITVLNQELDEMKRIAKSIRQLAGVTEFEATTPKGARADSAATKR